MGDVDGRLLMLLLWGGGTVGAYGQVFWTRLVIWRHRRDSRARRDLLEAAGLLMTAAGSAASIAVLLMGPAGSGIRGVAVAMALGAFLAVGIFMAQERPKD